MAGLAEEIIDEAPWMVWGRRGAGLAAVIAVGGGIYLLAKELSGTAGPQQKQMAKIRIVPDTPPPPPPPPKEEKRPEPPKDAKEVKVEQPKPDQPQPTEQLKMEGQASDNGMAGLIGGKVTQEYKGGPLGRGGGWYGAVIERELQRALTRDERMRGVEFRVVLRLWLTPEGRINRFELVQSSGSSATDDSIRQALAEMPPLRERPPEDMAQPIRLRITGRS